MDMYTAKILRRRVDGETVTLYFSTNMPQYEAGQYITVVFEDTDTPEGKSYSLSSAPFEDIFSITVKPIGQYSDRLCAMKVGDEFSHTAAYGYFNIQTNRPLICLAAGVGISPIWSVVKQVRHDDDKRHITLAYSGSKHENMAFLEEVTALKKADVAIHITQEQGDWRSDRINAGEYVRPDAVYLICGPVGFTQDMWRQLIDKGVETVDISTEVFFE